MKEKKMTIKHWQKIFYLGILTSVFSGVGSIVGVITPVMSAVYAIGGIVITGFGYAGLRGIKKYEATERTKHGRKRSRQKS